MIGVFGGTFNPVHNGHLQMALAAANELQLDHVKMIPCGIPPHRASPEVTGAIRWQLLQAALVGQPQLLADDCELKRSGASYTIDTLVDLNQKNSDSLCLILGQDAFDKLTTWHKWQQLFDYCHIAVLRRPSALDEVTYEPPIFPDSLKARIIEGVQALKSKPNGNIIYLANQQLDISSSTIRHQLEQGLSVKGRLPDAVLSIIQEKGLYSSTAESE